MGLKAGTTSAAAANSFASSSHLQELVTFSPVRRATLRVIAVQNVFYDVKGSVKK